MFQDRQITAELIDKALAEVCEAEVCEKGGYCTKLTVQALLKKYQGNLTAEHFATSVLYAEGLHPKYSDGRDFIEKTFSNVLTKLKQY